MIDVKEAAQRASQYFADLYETESAAVQLEEVELTEDGKFWLITLSYPVRRAFDVPIPPFMQQKREYKLFKIDTKTGGVRSMKIRKLD